LHKPRFYRGLSYALAVGVSLGVFVLGLRRDHRDDLTGFQHHVILRMCVSVIGSAKKYLPEMPRLPSLMDLRQRIVAR